LITGGTNEKMQNFLQLVGKGSRELLFKFWDPSISQGWLKLETSNLARILITRGTNEKVQN